MAAKKALGRGFESLIPDELFDESFDPTAQQDVKVSDLKEIPLGDITADPEQPRRHFEQAALDELAESVREHGIVQPIVVTPSTGGYTIVAGERRYRAAKQAGLDTIPAIVRTLSNQHKLELSLIENLQRKDLNPLETATAYVKLRDQFNLTMEQIGKRVGGRSTSGVNNTIRLLRLPEVVKNHLASGELSEGQARPLIGAGEATIEHLLPQILKDEWSARRIEAAIKALRNGEKPTEPIPVKYQDEAKQLADSLATKVGVKTTKRGAGTISISFKNDKEFQRLRRVLER